MKQRRRDFVKATLTFVDGAGLAPLCVVEDALADKSSVSLDTIAPVTKGSTIRIKVLVTHNGNNFLHYTQWLHVMVNGKEIARWDYSWRKRPENGTFTREVPCRVDADMEITAEAHCNIHGSKGPATVRVRVKT